MTDKKQESENMFLKSPTCKNQRWQNKYSKLATYFTKNNAKSTTSQICANTQKFIKFVKI